VTGGLALEAVSHAYGDLLAVADVTLTVAPGELLCLLGPSGCGKTTLLRVAAGLEPLQAGRIVIGDRVVAEPGRSLPPEQRSVGLVFQDYALFPHLNVLDNVAFGLHRLPRELRRSRALELLERVGLADRAALYPDTLSGGQQQRVALARALAPRPPVMLLDEPFSGLDSRLREQVREETRELLEESGAAVLMVTHDPTEAMALGDRLAIMRDGRLEQIGTPAQVYLQPASAFVAAFLSEVNRLRGTVRAGAAATPFGPVAAPGYQDGQSVEVLVRPEAVRLAPASANGSPGSGQARVRWVRLLGPSSLISLETPGSDGEPVELRALTSGAAPFERDDLVSLTADPSQTYVYPLEA
jgi:iron(III) transport system ATP-binding protein